MKGITIKLPEELHRRLADEARASGRSIAAVVRAKLEAGSEASSGSVHHCASDLAGIIDGGRQPATNQRRRFRKL